MLALIAYHAVSEGNSGQSLGKFVARIVVVMDDERPCAPWAACVRSFVFALDSLILACVYGLNLNRHF